MSKLNETITALRGRSAAGLRRVGARARALTRADLWRLSQAGLLLAATWALFWILARHLTYSWPSLDEKHFMWEGWSLNKGLAPYRDFTDFKPPLIFVINALAVRLLSIDHQHYRYLFTFLAGAAITGLVLVLMSRRVGKLLIFALVIIIHLLWIDPHFHDSSFDDAESIGMSFYLLGLAALLLESRAKRWTDLAGGALMAMAVLSKEPYALLAIPTWAAVLLFSLGTPDARRAIKRYVKCTLLGVALVALWLVGYLIAKGSLRAYITAVQQYVPFAKKICINFGAWTPEGFWIDWGKRITRLTQSLVNFERLGVTLPLLIATLVFVRRKRWPALVATWAVAAGGLYAITLGDCYFEHYFMLGMAAFFFVMVVGLLELGPALEGLAPRWRVFLGLAVAVPAAWQLWPRVQAELKATYVASSPPLEAPEVVKFVKEHSKPGDTVFSTGWPGIYVESDRRNAVKESTFFDAFIDLYPGTTDEDRLAPVYQELVKSRPKIIYLEKWLDYKRIRTVNTLVVPLIRDYGYKQVTDRFYVRPD